MTDEQLAHEAMQDYAEELNRIHQEELKILDNLQSKISNDFYDDIVCYMDECGSSNQYEITNKKPDDRHKQCEDYDHIREAWVNQYCNGGYIGDDFAGQVWIKINDKEYFTFHYQC